MPGFVISFVCLFFFFFQQEAAGQEQAGVQQVEVQQNEQNGFFDETQGEAAGPSFFDPPQQQAVEDVPPAEQVQVQRAEVSPVSFVPSSSPPSAENPFDPKFDAPSAVAVAPSAYQSLLSQVSSSSKQKVVGRSTNIGFGHVGGKSRGARPVLKKVSTILRKFDNMRKKKATRSNQRPRSVGKK